MTLIYVEELGSPVLTCMDELGSSVLIFTESFG